MDDIFNYLVDNYSNKSFSFEELSDDKDLINHIQNNSKRNKKLNERSLQSSDPTKCQARKWKPYCIKNGIKYGYAIQCSFKKVNNELCTRCGKKDNPYWLGKMGEPIINPAYSESGESFIPINDENGNVKEIKSNEKSNEQSNEQSNETNTLKKEQLEEINLLKKELENIKKKKKEKKKKKKKKEKKEKNNDKIKYDQINIEGVSYLYEKDMDEIYEINDDFGFSLGKYNSGNIKWNDGEEMKHKQKDGYII